MNNNTDGKWYLQFTHSIVPSILWRNCNTQGVSTLRLHLCFLIIPLLRRREGHTVLPLCVYESVCFSLQLPQRLLIADAWNVFTLSFGMPNGGTYFCTNLMLTSCSSMHLSIVCVTKLLISGVDIFVNSFFWHAI
jgi:hypothetical protein